ncbi:hypothetical protein FRB95_003656 [Tulasnella sp. JGI-2019a]|nr:hypothetical protein FRB95_003656 [Tulasnella sp. JGI-2019a]
MSDEAEQSRILIIGKANAGKTSILKKICSETEMPIIRDVNGKPLTETETLHPMLTHGMHDIENEIIYPSRPGFAFHDSRGIESGSMDKVAEFLSRRAKLSLKDRVHVAWICFPLSNAQPLGEAERCMPQLGPNPGESRHPELSVKTSLMLATVPAVVVFTEYNGLEATVLNNLRYEGRLSMREAFRAMSDATEHLFKEQ